MDQKNNDKRPPVGHTTKRFLDWVNADENLPSVEDLEHHDQDEAHGHDDHHAAPSAEPIVVEVLEIDEELVFPDPILEDDLVLEEKASIAPAEDHEHLEVEGHGHPPAKKSKRGKRPPKRRKNNTTGSRFFYVFIGGLLALIIIAALVLTVSQLPPFGSPDNPTVRDNEVYEKYVVDGQKDTGAVNLVAGMILDYRAFDTLGESVMLFTATMAVIMLIREAKKEPSASADRGKEEA